MGKRNSPVGNEARGCGGFSFKFLSFDYNFISFSCSRSRTFSGRPRTARSSPYLCLAVFDHMQ